jgi:WD40 repeat protein
MTTGSTHRPRRFTLLLAILACFVMLSGCSEHSAPTSSIEVAAKGIHGAAISDDGKFSSVGSIHHGGSLWRNSDGERLFNWNHKQDNYTTIVSSDFSPDHQWALTSDPHTMVLWNMSDGSAFRFWTAPGEVLSTALSENGNFALLGLGDHTAVVFDIKRGGIKRTFGHQNRVRSVDLSNDGRYAITGSEDYTAALWDMASGQKIFEMPHDDDVQLVALSPDGSLALSVAKYDSAKIWDTKAQKVLGSVPLAAEKLRRGLRFTAAKFSADNQYLLTGRPDQTVQLWNARTLKLLKTWKLPKRKAWKPTSSAALAVAFGSTNGKYVAVASNGFIHHLSR